MQLLMYGPDEIRTEREVRCDRVTFGYEGERKVLHQADPVIRKEESADLGDAGHPLLLFSYSRESRR